MPLNSSEIIGITMGCPVGIGPEIIVKMLSQVDLSNLPYTPVILGVPEVLLKSASHLGVTATIVEWRPGDPFQKDAIHVCVPPELRDRVPADFSHLQVGLPNRQTGLIMGACISYCVELIQKGTLAAMVTCPITKAALQQAGYNYPGHTEMLADLCGSADFAMMMAGKTLRVTLVTIHEGVRRIADLLTVEKVLALIDRTGQTLRVDFNIVDPKIAVAAFNPHAGENGLFGSEEKEIIEPAIEQARQLAWDVHGPFPPDTVFHKASRGEFDVVVCMYHDQGLIPFKLLHFEDGVNVTIGLPIIRTSVDHGTAYDIAGKGLASYASLLAAYKMAAEIAENRKKIV